MPMMTCTLGRLVGCPVVSAPSSFASSYSGSPSRMARPATSIAAASSRLRANVSSFLASTRGTAALYDKQRGRGIVLRGQATSPPSATTSIAGCMPLRVTAGASGDLDVLGEISAVESELHRRYCRSTLAASSTSHICAARVPFGSSR